MMGMPVAMMGGGGGGGGGGGATARYWRVYCSANNGDLYIGIQQVMMALEPAGVDQCTGGVAIASGFTSPYLPSRAFNTSTVSDQNWAHRPVPQWIGYDFGAGNDKTIKEVRLRARVSPYSGTQMVKDFTVDYSSDALTWTTAASFTGQTAWTSLQTRSFTVQA